MFTNFQHLYEYEFKIRYPATLTTLYRTLLYSSNYIINIKARTMLNYFTICLVEVRKASIHQGYFFYVLRIVIVTLD